MISKYSNFLIDKLLESVMVSSADFLSILNGMTNTAIGNKLYGVIVGEHDVKTNYNLIGLSDKNDEISFLPDSQYQRFKEKGENPWTKTKSKSKIGRMVRQLLMDNGSNVTDAQIEEFVNQFKAEWDKRNSTNRKIEIVNGDKILYWYNQDHYYGSGGTLGNSCMRFPEKNKYMKIYASNPNKISMVILTEDNKLIARALLWKLDQSTNGKKIYLDRVYYKNDSDYRYVHDWVFENIAKGDENIFASHSKIGGGEMMCKLENVKFDEYPYADTFNCLYKRLEGGKITGDGMVSNVNKSSEYPNFVISELLDTAGREDIKTHRYSVSLDVYIKRDDAVFIESLDSYIYKKDAKYSNYTGSYYLEKEVIYSKAMDDWIPNKIAVDHPKYGVIPTSYLVDVITEYIGTKTTTLGIYHDMRNYQSCTKSEKMLKNGDEYFRATNSPVYSARNYDVKLKISDIWGYNYPNFICFKVYKVKDQDEFSKIVDELKIPYTSRNDYFITKETSDFFNIPVEETDRYVYPTDYIERLDINFYFDYLKIKDEIKASEEITIKYDEFMKELHDFRYQTDGSYRQNVNDQKISKKIGKEKYEILKEIVGNSIDEVVKNIDPIRFKRMLEDIGSNSLNDGEITIMMKLMPLSYIYYMLTDSWNSSYREVRNFLYSKNDSISRNVAEVASALTIYELGNMIRSVFDRNLDKLINDSKLEIDISDFKSYLLSNYSKDKLYKVYSDLDLGIDTSK